ncbi:helix-turn-helix transcriptional regulator [Kribbella sp. CA-247076]|uniref:helix-turn-helix transcriptional regulator n=1 Tax=Kribbella sp. CA-247076 TaxID=3239941 RepID=UPI003D94360C
MLIGRDAERRVIEQLVAGARVGVAGVLLVTGEPGIGKTALLDEAATLTTGLRLLRARGTEAEQDVPFGALHQLLRPALAELDRIPRPQQAALEAALALGPVESPADRFAVGAATLSLICRYAEDAPVAVIVDDAHLLDRPSAEALLFAARRFVADPIVALIGARQNEPHPLADADLPSLVLEGVPLTAAQQLVHGLPVDLVAQLHRTVAGNPLALLELAGEPAALHRLTPGVPMPVPALLAKAFTARANRLSPAARTTLLVAAVDDGELGAVARACKELGVEVSALAEAETAALVAIHDGRVEFRHPLVRSAVYTSADPAERRTVHRAVAGATQDEDRRAWHLSETVLGTDDEVAGRLEVAAGHAAGRGAHAVAATAYQRAARLTESPQGRALRLVAAGEAAWSAGLPDRAEALLDEALALQPGAATRIRAQEIRAELTVKCGSPAQARDILLAAAAECEDDAIATGLLADAVNACFRLCDTASALRAAEGIDQRLPSVERPGPRIIGMMASGVAKILAGQGGTDQIREAVALAPSDELDRDRRRQVWMAIAPLFLRESGTGRALLQQAMLERRDQVALGTLPGLLFVLARDDATTDRWADAAASYDEGVRLAREIGQTTELAMNLAGHAWLAAHQGRVHCQTLAAEALRICDDRDISLGAVWSLFGLGDFELGRGDPAAALSQYERLLAVLAANGLMDPDLSPVPEMVEAYRRLGRAADAEAVSREYLVRAQAKGQPWSLARAARVRGLVSESADDFERALECHAETLDVFEQARTRLTYGAWLRRARRRVDARTQLRLAVEAFDHLGAAGWADQAATELKATGETARRRVPSTADELTPQERQIALLLADGQSIREAAARLFLSPKTVEYHLRKVYTKLGIHSRTELARELSNST